MQDGTKVALVTGGLGGLGTAICEALAAGGHLVIASYHNRSHENASQWLQEQQARGYQMEIIQADVRDYDACRYMQDSIQERFGGVDILVNNAGITADAQLRKMSLVQWQAVIDTNLNSLFNVTKNCLDSMIAKGFGRIINISSINAQKGQFGQTNYASAKAGVYGFTRSLAQEVVKKGITVNSVSPGYLATQMVMNIPEKIRQSIIDQIPMGRLGTPAEVARVVTFLADEKSSFITGSNIAINGGQFLQ